MKEQDIEQPNYAKENSQGKSSLESKSKKEKNESVSIVQPKYGKTDLSPLNEIRRDQYINICLDIDGNIQQIKIWNRKWILITLFFAWFFVKPTAYVYGFKNAESDETVSHLKNICEQLGIVLVDKRLYVHMQIVKYFEKMSVGYV